MRRVLLHRVVRPMADLLAWSIFEAHIEPLEVWTAINALLWGLWVMNPFVDVFGSAPGFRTMATLPQWLWGLVAILASSVQLAGRIHGNPQWQRVGARSIAALWMFAAAALASVNWRFPATVSYPLLALASLLVSYRSQSYPKRAADVPLIGEDCHGGA